VTAETTATFAAPTAQQQTSLHPDRVLHSANAGAIVERVAQVRAGLGSEARRFSREMAESINSEHAGVATVFLYEETFGTKDRLHWLLHLRSIDDYETLLRGGGGPDLRNGVFGSGWGEAWQELFVEGGTRETLLLPHRWGMFGTATEAMAKDPSTSPNAPGEEPARFIVAPAQEQTSLARDRIVHSANAGVVMSRVIDFTYAFRAEARVFARTAAENVNLNMDGLASAFVYEEAFGQMDRIHFLIHMRSLRVFPLLMGLDARTDAGAPRTTYIQDWVSMEKGGGSWDRMTVQGSTQDCALTPQHWTTQETGGH
jgi:hypothetical protein